MNWCWFLVNIKKCQFPGSLELQPRYWKGEDIDRSEKSSLYWKYELSRFYQLTPSTACSACTAWGFSSCLAFFQLCECMRRALNALKPIGPDQRRAFEEFEFWLLRLCLHPCYGIQRTLKCVSKCCGFKVLLESFRTGDVQEEGHRWGSKVWPLSVFIIATFHLNRI